MLKFESESVNVCGLMYAMSLCYAVAPFHLIRNKWVIWEPKVFAQRRTLSILNSLIFFSINYVITKCTSIV